ncbi:hypothetical protein GW758_00220 [Candidatus Falkowbacteria bacterium]|nr:hypothetical protein [Candidatus Falkowbacteria bacterium]NCT54370.1 hypothetical protein [Candidatus Falkowbacteria bacterium]
MRDGSKKNLNEINIFLNQYFNLILIILVLISLVLSYLLILSPKHRAAELLIKDNISNQQLLLNQQQKKLYNLKIISDIYSKVPSDDLLKFNLVLPYQYKQEQLFGEFEEIANKNGWILTSVSLSYPDESLSEAPSAPLTGDIVFGSLNPKVGRVEVSLSLSGLDYQGVKKLLTVMEENLRLFDIKQISFSGEEVQLILITYYYKTNDGIYEK